MLAASRAVTVMMLVPFAKAMLGTLQPVVPVAVPEPPRLLDQTTCVTPMLSEAVPARVVRVALALVLV